MILKHLGDTIHQSYFVVAMAIGIVAGVILVLWFRINFFASPVWILFAIILLVIAYLTPKLAFVVVALLAGMVMAFYRCATELNSGAVEQYKKNVVEENTVLEIRDWFAERIESLLPEPEVKLGLSYLLGMKKDLPEDLSNNLRMVGLTHIVVASGAHLSILVGVARRIFGRISRFAGVFFAILFILFFMTMVGFTPSILRAGIMSIITLVLFYFGRTIEPWRMILLVAAVTLMMNPRFVMELGWLLSFASFGGIMVVGPKLTKYYYGTKKPKLVGSIVITTVAATMMTLPITLYYFGMVSLISVVANLFILPTLSIAMGLVFAVGVVVGLPVVQDVVTFLATKMLDYHIVVIEFFGKMEQFVIEVKPYNAKMFWLYLVIAVPFVVVIARRWHKGFRSTAQLKSGKINAS